MVFFKSSRQIAALLLIAFAMSLGVVAPALAANWNPKLLQPCISKFEEFGGPSPRDDDNVRRFQREIAQSTKTLEAMAISADNVTNVIMTEEGGAFASAVAKVQTSNGSKFLKIWDGGSTPKNHAHTIVIQNVLAQEGIAPQTTSYLSPEQIKNLVARFPRLKKSMNGRRSTFGVLMEHLDIQWHVHADNGVPMSWTKQALEDRVRHFEQVMEKYRLAPPTDLQAAFDKRGRLMLFDFDSIGHVTNDGKVYSYVSSKPVTLEHYISEVYDGEARFNGKQDRFQIDAAGGFHVRLSRLRRDLGLAP